MKADNLRFSDRVRLEYILRPKPKLKLKGSMFDFLYNRDDLVYAEKAGRALNYYEGYNNNCLDVFNESYDMKDFAQVVVSRMQKIAEIAGYELADVKDYGNRKILIKENPDYPHGTEWEDDSSPLDDSILFYVEFRLVPKPPK